MRRRMFTFKDEQCEVIGVFNYFNLPVPARSRALHVKRAPEVNLFFHGPLACKPSTSTVGHFLIS